MAVLASGARVVGARGVPPPHHARPEVTAAVVSDALGPSVFQNQQNESSDKR